MSGEWLGVLAAGDPSGDPGVRGGVGETASGRIDRR
jgi:hypothetical protein